MMLMISKRRYARTSLLKGSAYGAALLLMGAIAACQSSGGEPQGDATSSPTAPAVGLEAPLANAASTEPALPMAEAPPSEEAAPPPSPEMSISEPEFSEAIRADYNPIDLEGRSPEQRSGDDPEAMAQAMFGAQEAMEGSYSEGSTAEIGNEQAVVIFTQENLPDDSVQAIRTRVEFLRVDGPWQMQWAGEQYRCREGRGQQDWGKKLCS